MLWQRGEVDHVRSAAVKRRNPQSFDYYRCVQDHFEQHRGKSRIAPIKLLRQLPFQMLPSGKEKD